MRTAAEIRFRVAQEAWNLWLLWRQPADSRQLPAPIDWLPDAAEVAVRLRGSSFAQEVQGLAKHIAAHRFPIFGSVIETGPAIAWRRDYVHRKESGLDYFRRIPYLDFDRVGDHKMIWELNRHQHLVVLAQAFLFTGRMEFLDEIGGQLKSWWDANPFQRGINWASALEVAFRSLSWIWVYHFAGSKLTRDVRERLVRELYRHGLHLEHNLSIYFSPNTHLLGEAVALHVLGRLFTIDRWRRAGAAIVEEQLDRQVRDDGAHFEQSSYYHVYALDLFLLHYVAAGRPERFRRKLGLMGEYLNALLGPGRSIPLIGDDDGGRLFHPYGERRQFGRATLATCSAVLEGEGWPHDDCDVHQQASWWIGKAPRQAQPALPRSQLFQECGLAVMECEDVQVLIKAGPFGANRAGHSHSDCLSIVVRRGGADILIDPGTFTYVADAGLRSWLRSTVAHNTVRIDGRDQGTQRPQFGWLSKPDVEIHESRFGQEDFLDASVRYDGFRHRRRVTFRKPHWLWVVDEIEGPAGDHLIEQFWHPGLEVEALPDGGFRIGPGAQLVVEATAECEEAWRSSVFGQKLPAPVVVVRRREALPLRISAVVDLSGGNEAIRLDVGI